MRPDEIEQASMRTIAAEMEPWTGPAEDLDVVKRVIHTTADFEFQKNLRFTPDAVSKAREALRRGVTVITDTMMAAAGVVIAPYATGLNFSFTYSTTPQPTIASPGSIPSMYIYLLHFSYYGIIPYRIGLYQTVFVNFNIIKPHRAATRLTFCVFFS